MADIPIIAASLKNSNISLDAERVRKLERSATLYNRSEIDWYHKFNRFGCLDPYNRLGTSKEYVFFTKPDLHIFSNRSENIMNPELEKIPFFKEAHKRYLDILTTLQQDVSSRKSPFICILSNALTSNLDLPGIESDFVETSKNIHGTTISYRKTSYNSDNAFDFTLEFEDTKYLEIYHLFKIYDEYQRMKYYGTVTPPSLYYVENRILHDQIAIYKFIVGEDRETILFYAKLYGCFPKSVPREAMSEFSQDGQLKFTVQWRSQFVEDSDPLIIYDFNRLVNKYHSGPNIPIWDDTELIVDGQWVNSPYIIEEPSKLNAKAKYKLKWR